jgi:hypothetical protein
MTAPIAAPASDADEEYTDLAIEPKYQKKAPKKSSKPKATAPVQEAPSETSTPAPSGNDIDLAY